MANAPGLDGNTLPGVYSTVETLSRGVSAPGGTRLPAIMGLGSRVEVLVSSAQGDAEDGLNSTFTSTSGSDGRHFRLSNAPVISNRTNLFKNGIPLVGTEGVIDGTSFNSRFDYKLDITTGNIELQKASLVDQGGAFYSASSLNVGNGTISNLELIDPNAPTETWTIRVTSVRRDGYSEPIDGYSSIAVTGSVSGRILDGYGQVITWSDDSTVVSNGIISFAVNSGSTSFLEGDRFTVEVKGGALLAGDSLTATYIAEIDINDIEFFTDINALTAKHGSPSLANTLSLGAQLAFSNQPPGVFACQAAPSVPRRVSYTLETSASGEDDNEDLQFALPLDVTPDADSKINFFVTDPVTGVETQVVPNKTDFYDPTITSNPDSFHFGSTFTFSYTVILTDSIQKEGSDGVITSVTSTTGTLSSSSVLFTADDTGATRQVKIFNASNADNNGTFDVVSVEDGVITLSNPDGFVDETGIEFQVTDSSTQSSIILFTDDLALSVGQSLRATVVDTRDADFFDAGWVTAYEALETVDCDIVVPLPTQTISQIFQNGKQHVLSMSNIKNRRERVLFIGAISGLKPANVIGTEDAAVEDIGILEGIQGDEVTEILAGNIEDLANYGVENSYGDTFRVVFFYPDQIVVQVGADRTLVSGYYIAAAAAGYLAGVPQVSIPLTNKTLSGFTILRDKIFRPITLEQLTSSGITVLQPIAGGGRVLHGKTTTNSGFVEEQEISIIFIRDKISKNMRAAFRGFIGNAESSTLQGSLISRASGVLNGFISQGLITQFRDLKVARDGTDPTQWNVSVAVAPVYPVNFIYIRFSIGVL